MKRLITHCWFCAAFAVIFFSCATAPEVKELSPSPDVPKFDMANPAVTNPGTPNNTVQNIAAPNTNTQKIETPVFELPIADAPAAAPPNIDSSNTGARISVMPEVEALKPEIPKPEVLKPESLPAWASLPVMETPGQETVLRAVSSITLPAPPVEMGVVQVSGPPVRPSIPAVPEYIMGEGLILPEDMTAFLLGSNPEAEKDFVVNLMSIYIEEAAIEGVNHDAAFAQMCLETGFLRFGGLVTPDMNNFCGLGAIGPGQNGESFPDPRTGVRAHIQHLKAYATDAPLKQELVDPRYFYVRFGSSPAIKGLAGTWAVDLAYAEKIKSILERLYSYVYGT